MLRSLQFYEAGGKGHCLCPQRTENWWLDRLSWELSFVSGFLRCLWRLELRQPVVKTTADSELPSSCIISCWVTFWSHYIRVLPCSCFRSHSGSRSRCPWRMRRTRLWGLLWTSFFLGKARRRCVSWWGLLRTLGDSTMRKVSLFFWSSRRNDHPR